MQPRYSVVIPTYNRRPLLGDAIASALAQQDFGGDIEVLVVDDGSTDGTLEWLAETYAGKPVRGLRNQRRKGPAGGRNTGILAARGELVALLDSDDRFLPNHLADAARAFAALPEVDAVFGPARYERNGVPDDYMGPNYRRKLAQAPVQRRIDGGTAYAPSYFDHLLEYGCYFNLSSVVLRAGAARELMNEALRIAEDYEFWVRLARTHRFASLDAPQIRYMLHADNISFEADASVEQHAPKQLDAYGFMLAYPGLTATQRRTIEQQMAGVLFDWGYRCRQRGMWGQALRLHWRSLRLGMAARNLAAIAKLPVAAVAGAGAPRDKGA